MQRNEMTHPSYIICPLTKLIYNEPVTIAPSGHVYEWEWLMQIIERAKAEGKPALCPETREPILGYVKMFKIANVVEDYLAKYPEAKEDQYQKENHDKHLPSTPVIFDQSQPVEPKSNRQPRNEISADDRVAIEAAQAELNRIHDQRHNVHQPFNPRNEGEFWRELRERARRDEREEAARQIQRLEELRCLEQERERERALRERLAREREHTAQQNKELRGNDEKNRRKLLVDIQNLIFALKFESGPEPQGMIQNDSLVFFALIERAFLQPLPWQKILVKEGPRNRDAMYSVLKAAVVALKQLDPDVLNREREQHKGEFDKVKTIFGGECSYSNSNYVLFANAMGTVKNQPGYLINEILKRVDAMFAELQPKYQHRH